MDDSTDMSDAVVTCKTMLNSMVADDSSDISYNVATCQII